MFTDWLLDRRHCNIKWQSAIKTVREKISAAIKDMPENQEIKQLLSGSCMWRLEHLDSLSHSYFTQFSTCQKYVLIHFGFICFHSQTFTTSTARGSWRFWREQRLRRRTSLADIRLREWRWTDSHRHVVIICQNLQLGPFFLFSQDWQEIVSLYEADNVYLGESINSQLCIFIITAMVVLSRLKFKVCKQSLGIGKAFWFWNGLFCVGVSQRRWPACWFVTSATKARLWGSSSPKLSSLSRSSAGGRRSVRVQPQSWGSATTMPANSTGSLWVWGTNRTQQGREWPI